MNNVSIVGRIGTVVFTEGADDTSNRMNFSVAINKKIKDKEITTWVNCVAWAGTADFMNKFFPVGKVIAVQGELETSQWEDKDSGAKRSATNVVARQVSFVPQDKKADTDSSDDAPAF